MGTKTSCEILIWKCIFTAGRVWREIKERRKWWKLNSKLCKVWIEIFLTFPGNFCSFFGISYVLQGLILKRVITILRPFLHKWCVNERKLINSNYNRIRAINNRFMITWLYDCIRRQMNYDDLMLVILYITYKL